MTIHDELGAELRDALKQRDRDRADVIRQVESEVSLARTAPGFSGAVDDDLYRRVIASYVKKMTKARDEYRGLGEAGRSRAEKLDFEVSYLARWLPPVLDEAATGELVRQAIADLGATGAGDTGRVVGHLMKSGHEGLDGGTVHRLVRRELGAG